MTVFATQKSARVQPDSAWTPLLQTATREVFEAVLAAETVPAAGLESPEAFDVTALVAITGAVCGVIRLRCSIETAMHMASRMSGKDAQEFDDDIRDALGEICNRLAGTFKTKITGLSDACLLSVPTVISGGDYRIHLLADAGRVEVAMAFNGGPFWVTLDLHT